MAKKQKTVKIECRKGNIARTEYARFTTPIGTPLYEENVRGRDGNGRKKGARLVIAYYSQSGVEFRTSVWADSYTDMEEMFNNAPAFITREIDA